MPAPIMTEDEFVCAWEAAGGSTAKMARQTGVSERCINSRRRAIEGRRGIELRAAARGPQIVIKKHVGKIEVGVENGIVIVFSDAHFWPGFKTTANRALVALCRQLRPVGLINAGDSFDGASISRFPRPFFDEGKPSVLDELRICEERLGEIAKAAPGAWRIWTLGNHDLRYEAKLAANVPEYQGIQGFHLKDRFPEWRPAWSAWINDEVEIRHRYRGGIHATHNNVQANHHSTITGHLHALQVRPYTDGRGQIKYGVDVGTLADSDGPQFTDYLEGRQPNWRSGFVILTFRDGQLLMPEPVQKFDEDHVQFRGHVLHADTLAIA